MISVTGTEMGLRESKKAATRAAIIETGVRLFRTVGFDQARVRDVVAELRISEATFFNYFPTKRAVLDAAAQDLLDRSLDQLRVEVEADERTVRARLERIADDFASNFTGDRQLAVLLASHTQLLLIDRSRDSETRRLFTRLFTSGQQRGEVRSDISARRLTDAYLSYGLATINSWATENDDDDPLDEQLRIVLDLFWSGAATPVAPLTARRHRRAVAARTS